MISPMISSVRTKYTKRTWNFVIYVFHIPLYSVFVLGIQPLKIELLVYDQLSPFQTIIDPTQAIITASLQPHLISQRSTGRTLQLQNVQQPCPEAGYFDTSPNPYRVLVLEYETSTRDIQMSINLPDMDILSWARRGVVSIHHVPHHRFSRLDCQPAAITNKEP